MEDALNIKPPSLENQFSFNPNDGEAKDKTFSFSQNRPQVKISMPDFDQNSTQAIKEVDEEDEKV